MSIDERLEALAQSVELMCHENRDFERQMRQAIQTLVELHADGERSREKLQDSTIEMQHSMTEMQRSMTEMQRSMTEMQRAIARLAHIAVNHEDRIAGIERKSQ